MRQGDEEYRFASDMLIADAGLFKDHQHDIMWVGTLTYLDQSVNVLFVNAKNAEEIPEVIAKDRQAVEQALKAEQEKEVPNAAALAGLSSQKAYHDNLALMMSQDVYRKKPDSRMLKDVTDNNIFSRIVQEQNVLLLSSVSSMNKLS